MITPDIPVEELMAVEAVIETMIDAKLAVEDAPADEAMLAEESDTGHGLPPG